MASLRSQQVSDRMQVVETTTELSRAAGLGKCRDTRLSLADASAPSLTKRLKGTLLTTDSVLAQEKDVRVRRSLATSERRSR